MVRDKVAKLKQIKDVYSFNEEFLRIFLDIPNISEHEKMYHYTRALEQYVWKEMCTREYGELSKVMKSAQ